MVERADAPWSFDNAKIGCQRRMRASGTKIHVRVIDHACASPNSISKQIVDMFRSEKIHVVADLSDAQPVDSCGYIAADAITRLREAALALAAGWMDFRLPDYSSTECVQRGNSILKRRAVVQASVLLADDVNQLVRSYTTLDERPQASEEWWAGVVALDNFFGGVSQFLDEISGEASHRQHHWRAWVVNTQRSSQNGSHWFSVVVGRASEPLMPTDASHSINALFVQALRTASDGDAKVILEVKALGHFPRRQDKSGSEKRRSEWNLLHKIKRRLNSMSQECQAFLNEVKKRKIGNESNTATVQTDAKKPHGIKRLETSASSSSGMHPVVSPPDVSHAASAGGASQPKRMRTALRNDNVSLADVRGSNSSCDGPGNAQLSHRRGAAVEDAIGQMLESLYLAVSERAPESDTTLLAKVRELGRYPEQRTEKSLYNAINKKFKTMHPTSQAYLQELKDKRWDILLEDVADFANKHGRLPQDPPVTSDDRALEKRLTVQLQSAQKGKQLKDTANSVFERSRAKTRICSPCSIVPLIFTCWVAIGNHHITVPVEKSRLKKFMIC